MWGGGRSQAERTQGVERNKRLLSEREETNVTMMKTRRINKQN